MRRGSPPTSSRRGRGRRLVLHAMHSVVDWLAFAVWEDGRLVRSLSLSPGNGIIEDIGEPYPFELPYWNGEHPVPSTPGRPDEGPYPLPAGAGRGRAARAARLHRRRLGRARRDVDAEAVELLGFTVIDPDGPTPEERRAEFEAVVARMGEPRMFTYRPDGSVREVSLDLG
ncbi:hypothetical protein [Nonomuraea sp. GTA35]|uniref:DUF6928 family protein n=1 Tax=Nonomuraea sp. GTA35 TaxID=1676746 RepID=UPI0035C16D0C